jgi:hypothetical protein
LRVANNALPRELIGIPKWEAFAIPHTVKDQRKQGILLVHQVVTIKDFNAGWWSKERQHKQQY